MTPNVGEGPGWILAIDTATSLVVVAAGSMNGSPLGVRTFPAGHRHGSHLLPAIDALTTETGLGLDRLGGVVVGLGPGAFTGLRVGLATAKTLAHALALPIVGISTGEALLRAAGDGDGTAAGSGVGMTLLLPAGPHDRVVVAPGTGARLEAGDAGQEPAGAIAIDLEGRASEAALERGRHALSGLAATLLGLGAQRLAASDADDVERLVPAYVSLPRGVTSEVGDGGMAWSRDPR
ncbi:MAG: tRNA (adenosine(37)-N6)-threonylcarbamoyltransferase complex dimerization subunit type 1 TsaB [Chloroflexi bacterium]|nr:tRNA (adenosine(37)-N6)-threonylcarbamoyltransferase complex dimerization subunit type 1 TsaB [Chloroflexota bacterium]